ncbi:MAG: patatin-like phospholipase family protein [Solirubrobacteraceae bacterium]|jgi:NTE family protein
MRADAVFSGGGIKGLAFAGAVKAAEEAGYTEWQSLGGTSAGAIAAMAVAVGYDGDGLKGLFGADFSKIDDRGGPFGLGVVANYFDHGIVRGTALADWIESVLKGAPVKEGDQAPEKFGDLKRSLKVVGTDIVHERMVVFPDDAGLYLDDSGKPYTPESFPIATAVRISAGYPGFFPPIALTDAGTGSPGALVDGGVAASFPVFLFDDPKPRWPTWAFRLFGGLPPEQPPNSPIKGLFWPIDMIKDVIDTAIDALDSFELKTFPERVIAIPTGTVSTLNFSLSQKDKDFLYNSGYDTAKKFFDGNPAGTNRFGVNAASVPQPAS